ncbi:succinate dehydrogenase / fumarate reductase membrane anchor subunit [Sphingomonas jejuensis]|uniref:Succinate dehydrogenase hydrophobic membrane anchor subunit n=1 Tax=Sphingomonas jejuensis TaxID=904715 RepID=A0ABX0XNM3_9SPHN|nr:succinate dehydrogenase, hydrophobic membrane anchor protein [Sphingomonas jejuensis]NJC34462.1 succinate dehydrogenase / fumarate reductase membrane anchor subunit [Sphingomonas jejuensis]
MRGGGTSIGRVRGLGSAKSGTHHWWMQRLTAGSNLFLLLWFVLSLARLPNLDHATVIAWIGSPLVAVGIILLVGSVFWHFRLGLQVVIEDYESNESRVFLLVLLNFFTVGTAALAIFAILRIAFAGSAA